MNDPDQDPQYPDEGVFAPRREKRVLSEARENRYISAIHELEEIVSELESNNNALKIRLEEVEASEARLVEILKRAVGPVCDSSEAKDTIKAIERRQALAASVGKSVLS